MSEESLQFKYFRTTGIDIKKLREQKDWRLILSMLRVYNDIALSSGISFLLQFAPNSPELKPIRGAVDSHLLRHRSAMAAEAMRNVIDPLKNQQNDRQSEIWTIIRGNEALTALWNEVSSAEFKAEEEKAKSVRDKLFAHYDRAPINCAFEKLLKLAETGEADDHIRWHIQSTEDNGQISRNVLLDELTMLAWYEMYEIEVSNDGPNLEQVAKVSVSLIKFLSSVANFVNELVIDYLQKYNLTTIDAVPPWHSGPDALEPI
jgi:hypothetical protein